MPSKDLGAVIRTSTPGKGCFASAKWIGVALALIGVYTAYSELFMQPEVEIGGLIFGLVILSLGLGLVVFERRKVKNPGSRYIVYENGIEHVTRKEQQITWWEDVVEINEAVMTIRPGGPNRQLPVSQQTVKVASWTIIDDRGMTMKLGNDPSLISSVKEAIIEPRWSLLAAKLEAGETAELGPATLTRTTVNLQGAAIPWMSIRQVRLRPPQIITNDTRVDWPDARGGNHLPLLLLQRAVEDLGG